MTRAPDLAIECLHRALHLVPRESITSANVLALLGAAYLDKGKALVARRYLGRATQREVAR